MTQTGERVGSKAYLIMIRDGGSTDSGCGYNCDFNKNRSVCEIAFLIKVSADGDGVCDLVIRTGY